jgi:hypothetical protein
MKRIYSNALVCCLLVTLSSQAQVNQAGPASSADTTAAEAPVQQTASNAVQAAEMVILTDELVQGAPLALRTPSAVATAPGPDGDTTEVISTNAVQAVTITMLQGQPLESVPATLSATAVLPGFMSPLDLSEGCAPPPPGLVSWWRGELDASDTAGPNSGTWVPGPGYASGEVGQAFSFNGTDSYVEIPYHCSLAPATFTIEGWIYPNAQASGQSFIWGQSYARQLITQPWGSGLHVGIYITTVGGAFHGLWDNNPPIPLNDWTHVAATWDATSLKLYVNGSLRAQATPGFSSIGDSGCPFSIGASGSCGTSQYFPGLIDELSLYSRALSADEISAIVEAGSAGKCTTPPVCAACPATAVAWWAAEGDASDLLGAHNGTPQNTEFVPGKVGQAFHFTGNNSSVQIANGSGLISQGWPGWSIEAWLNPGAPIGAQGWLVGQSFGRQLIVRPANKVALAVSPDPYDWRVLESNQQIPICSWSHVVGVWDASSATLSLYVNGSLDRQSTPGIVPWDSDCAWSIGGSWGQYFNGLIDEVTLYGSPLSADAVQALYNAGSAGKCPVAPTLTFQPASAQVTMGNDALLQVSAAGGSLSYQWIFNGEDMGGETQSTLLLEDFQSANAGTYTVRVSNDAGSITSAEAVLTLAQPAPVPVPGGVVAWWRGEGDYTTGDTDDIVGNNPATAVGLSYGAGKVGSSWFFEPPSHLLIPANGGGGLNSGSWEGFSVEGWIKPYDAQEDLQREQVILEQYDSASGHRITLSVAGCGHGSLKLVWVDSNGPHQLCSPPEALPRAWAFYHIALAYEDQQGVTFLRLYVNGRLVADSSSHIGVPLGASGLYFGYSPSGIVEGFYGYMDELSIYNRGLSGSEIQSIFNAGSAGKIPPCTQAPSGCISWWQGEGDGLEVYARNPALLPASGVSFSAGETGQAFTFDGTMGVRVPASASLNLGAGGGFTIEAWVKPASVATAQPILEWNSGDLTGVALWISASGTLEADIPDATLMDNLLSFGNAVVPGVFQHVALTYNSSDSTAHLFLNGADVGQLACSILLPILTTGDLCIGFSPGDDLGTGSRFAGQIDEVTLYSHALLPPAIKKLYTTGLSGKCAIAPSIVTQPGSQAAHAGNNVALQASASGTSLTYQWSFDNGTGPQPISGATSPVLMLMNLQAAQAGTYTVTAANGLGTASSSGAVLTVVPVGNGNPPVITQQPQAPTSPCEGGSFGLSVTASGSPLAYQWCKNGVNIIGATTSEYTCSPTSPSDAGTYTVVVYGSQGAVTSADAVVATHPRPTASVWGDTTIASGLPAIVQATLTGARPWTLTWSINAEVGGVSQHVESDVMNSSYALLVTPTSTTTYTLTSVVDANGCQAATEDLIGQATVTISGASQEAPLNAGIIPIASERHDDFTFQGDSTYYVSGTVDLYGTTTIEGGTCVKFSSASNAKIIIHDPDIKCDTSAYRPAVFAYADDRDYGYGGVEESPSPSGPYGGGIKLQFGSAATVILTNLHFRNLSCGLSLDSAGTYTLYHCQFADCDTAIAQTLAGVTLNVFNALFCDDNKIFQLVGGAQTSPSVNFQHITVNGCQTFVYPASSSGTWTGKNSLLVNVLNIPGNLDRDLQNCPTLTSTSGLFHTGDGSHYLADDTYRWKGSTDIDPTLLKELHQRTTHAPLDIPFPTQPAGYSAFESSGSFTLSPQVARCCAGGTAPDLGYAYDTLDYTLSGFWLKSGGKVTVLPGTVVGFRFDWLPGFLLDEGTSFISQGTPTKPITYVPVSLVQEGPFTRWLPGVVVSFIPNYHTYPDYNPSDLPPPELNFRFSDFYLGSGVSHHFWTGMGCVEVFDQAPNLFHVAPGTSASSAMSLQMRDCNLHSGWLNFGELDGFHATPVGRGGRVIPASVSLVNDLFDRVNVNLDPDTGPAWWHGPYAQATVDLSLAATNNLFRGGWLFLEPVSNQSSPWAFVNNLFDNVTVAQDVRQPFYYDNNAYYPQGSVTSKLNGTGGANDVSLSDKLPYQPGPLGNFYLPNSTLLYGAGSCPPGAVGLFHYTTLAGQGKEGEETAPHEVNIGLHYVALDAAGLPKDFDGDLIADYVENWHGDGQGHTIHADETDWQRQQTVSGILDSLSPLYDDVDLAGDGVVGRIKKALHPSDPQPLVPDNPLALEPVAVPGADPRTLTFRVVSSRGSAFDLPYSTVSSIGSLRLLVDGRSVALAAPDADPGKCLLTWNTLFAAPGSHVLKARLKIDERLTINASDDTSDLGYNPAVRHADGAIAVSTLNNLLQFEECYCQYSTSAGALLHALLPEQHATYDIELQTPTGEHVRWLVNNATTETGEINETWKPLTDDSGNPYAGDTAKGVITVRFPDSGRSDSAALPLFRFDDEPLDTSGPDNTRGVVTVAYCYDDGTPQWEIDRVVQNPIIPPLMAPGNVRFNYPCPAYGSYFNTYSLTGAGQSGYLNGQDSVAPLLKDLSGELLLPGMNKTKNFIFLGHGDDDRIGGSTKHPGFTNIDMDDIADCLGNHDYTYDEGKAPKTRYRFVFLHGCHTAADDHFPRAFGIRPTITAKYLSHFPNEAQAFVGYDSSAYPPLLLFLLPQRDSFIKELDAWNLFFELWQSDYTLENCISATEVNYSSATLPRTNLEAWNFGQYQEKAAKHFRTAPEDRQPRLVIKGYCGLTRTGFTPGYGPYNKNNHLYPP